MSALPPSKWQRMIAPRYPTRSRLIGRRYLMSISILKTHNKVWHAMPDSLADWQPKDTLLDTAISLFRVHRPFAYRVHWFCVHRIVHSGKNYQKPVIIDETVMAKLVELSPICPLHQPPALAVVTALQALDPRLIHIAAFDTAFHYHRPEI